MKQIDGSALVLKYLETATKDLEKWTELLHDDIIIEFPYAGSVGWPEKIQGKEVIKASIGEFLSQVPGLEFKNPQVFQTTDPNVLFATYDTEVKVSATGKTYKQKYISYFGLADGKIKNMAEYYDPEKIKEAFM